MLMCLSSSLVGVVAFIRRRSLVAEVLSHACYPGVVLAVFFAALFVPNSDKGLALFVLIGGFLSALLGLFSIGWLQRKGKMTGDASFCFVLSVFFGLGVLFASRFQVTHPLWYKQVQLYLYGQAATMLDIHVVVYALLAALVSALLLLFYRPIQGISFDRDFAASRGMKISYFELLISALFLLSILVGIRSVGVVLMAGMSVAPALTARQWTSRLSHLFFISATFGLLSGFCGNYLSVMIPLWMGDERLFLPTGPMILLSASLFCLASLLFAPEVGLASRLYRVLLFKQRCLQENLLKTFWKQNRALIFSEIRTWQPFSSLFLKLLLFRLKQQGWLEQKRHLYQLTEDGKKRAEKIIRLHRLWEVYLVDYLGQNVEKVHRNAEEMEHILILDRELEKELTELLDDPKRDPHQQPIPATDGPVCT
jgi:manganese/zinc/iron transport system permease protein